VLKSTEHLCDFVGEEMAVAGGAGTVHVEGIAEEFGLFEGLVAAFVAEGDVGVAGEFADGGTESRDGGAEDGPAGEHDEDDTGGGIFVAGENFTEPAAAVLPVAAGLGGVGTKDDSFEDLAVHARGYGDLASVPIDGEAGDGFFFLEVVVGAGGPPIASDAGLFDAESGIGEEGEDVLLEGGAFEEASLPGFTGVFGGGVGEGIGGEIGPAEQEGEVVDVEGVVAVIDKGVFVVEAIEGEDDGFVAAGGGVEFAEDIVPDAGVGAGDTAMGEAEGVATGGSVRVGELGGVIHAGIAEGEYEGFGPFGLVFEGAGEGELEHAGA